MPHLVLLGDSVFDNAAYTEGQPDVAAQVRRELGADWRVTLGALDGSTIADIGDQLVRLPAEATHLVLSVGGNDALLASGLLDEPVYSSADALRLVAAALRTFEADYRATVDACLARGLPLVVCTVYNGNFPEADYAERVAVALAVFDDAILRTARERGLAAIDLRAVCTLPSDYANPIEPSSQGGAKIARVIARVVTGNAPSGARVFGL